MSRSVFINGQILPEEDAGVSPFDLGLLRAHAVFDFMTAEGIRPFLYDEHYGRIVKSARFLNVEFPYESEQFRTIIEDLIERNGYARSIVRTVVTGGVSVDGITPSDQPSVLVLIYEYDPLPSHVYTEGARVITLDFARSFPNVKTTHYLLAVNNQQRKHDAGALELLYVQDGSVLEASTSNVFIVKDGAIATPHEGVLAGITRDLTIRLLAEEGTSVDERDLSLDELLSADEVFLTASGKDIVPITAVDDSTIGDGSVGTVTEQVMELYKRHYDSYYAR